VGLGPAAALFRSLGDPARLAIGRWDSGGALNGLIEFALDAGTDEFSCPS
jgi:hypothetical protein